jgi:hypothetical protein
MDRILKVIYNNRYKEEIILNGVHPAVLSYIQQCSDSNKSLHSIKDEIDLTNLDQKWSSFFRHANFLGYYTKHFKNENIITIDEIKEDNSIYLYPIEVGIGLHSFIEETTVTVNNITYTYTFIDTIDPIILLKLKSGQVKLLINIIHDPVNDPDMVNELETYFNSHGIDGSNIIIIGGNNFQEYYKYFPNSKIKITFGYIMVQQAGDRLGNFPYISSLGYESDAVREKDLNFNKIRSKKFLCWNRTMRTHRYWLAYLAIKYKLINHVLRFNKIDTGNSYFSFLNPSGGEVHSVASTIDKYVQNYDESYSYAQKIYPMIPYDLDTKHLTAAEKRGFSTNNNKKEFYENSYIHITSETIFDGIPLDVPFFSEKSFHAMVNLQPFIYVGCAGALKQLHEWGIKTFHPYIDESYDDEKDPVIRFKMIENEIRKLNEKPMEEIHEWYYSIKDTLLHNQQQLKTFSTMNPFENAFNDIKKFYSNQTT